MWPVAPLKLPPLPEQTALLHKEFGHANAAWSASAASVRHITEAMLKRSIDTRWARERGKS